VDVLIRGRSYSALCARLFLLAQDVDDTPGPERGYRWEARISEMLGMHGFPVETVPGGVRVFGTVPASGLRHQTDAAITCSDAHVLGEWKSYRGTVPKNEVLRFKAATDDLYESIASQRPRRPVLRLFGVGGDASVEVRRYAARHGITLLERTRWPVPALTDTTIPWPPLEGPSAIDCRQLCWLSRPLQEVYPLQPDGSHSLPKALSEPAVQALLDLQERWSDRLWDVFETLATEAAA
jgi:hypothetical protein